MAENIDDKPMTVRHIREVLLPAMEEVFATKKDLEVLRGDIVKFKDEILSGHDKILKDLEILMTEKVVSYHQWQKEQKLWAIVIDALKSHSILSSDQLQKIRELEVL